VPLIVREVSGRAAAFAPIVALLLFARMRFSNEAHRASQRRNLLRRAQRLWTPRTESIASLARTTAQGTQQVRDETGNPLTGPRK